MLICATFYLLSLSHFYHLFIHNFVEMAECGSQKNTPKETTSTFPEKKFIWSISLMFHLQIVHAFADLPAVNVCAVEVGLVAGIKLVVCLHRPMAAVTHTSSTCRHKVHNVSLGFILDASQAKFCKAQVIPVPITRVTLNTEIPSAA